MDRRTRWQLWWAIHGPTVEVAWRFASGIMAAVLLLAWMRTCAAPGYPDHRRCHQDADACMQGPEAGPPHSNLWE